MLEIYELILKEKVDQESSDSFSKKEQIVKHKVENRVIQLIWIQKGNIIQIFFEKNCRMIG